MRGRTLSMLIHDTGEQFQCHLSQILQKITKNERITFDVQPVVKMNLERNLAMSGCIWYDPDHLNSLLKEPQHAPIGTRKYF